MGITIKSAQRQLDLAAEELEQAGHPDLAEKVDYYNSRLASAAKGEIPLIKRALSRIQIEAKKRMKKDAQKDKPEKEKKAAAATLKARRSSDKRKEALRKKLREIAARRKRTASRLEKLRMARQERLKKDA
jgi:hypothetical protein